MDKKTQQNLAVLGIALVMVTFGYFKFLIGPLQAKNAESIERLKQTQTRLAEMKKRALELPKLQSEMKLLEMEVSELERRLPKDKELPGLLRTITKMGQKYSLRINTIAPGPVAAQPNYNEVPFTITAQGTYHNIALFFAEIGQESRILSVKDVNLTASAPTRENASTVIVTFTMVAYTFKS